MVLKLLFLSRGHAEGISKGLTHQSLQEPALVDAIARPFDRCTAGGQVQGTAGTKQRIQGPALIQTGIQQHRSPQRDPGTQER